MTLKFLYTQLSFYERVIQMNLDTFGLCHARTFFHLNHESRFRIVKTSPIRLIAVRETGVSRHQGVPIESPPETPRTSQHYHIEEINYVKG